MTKQVALVTGGSRGIGLGIAEHLAKAGYDLVIGGRKSREQVTEPLNALQQYGNRVEYFSADIADTIERAGLIDFVRKTFGRLNVLVNNAGIAPKTRLDVLEVSEESYETVMRVNLQGPFFLTQLAANWMIEQHQIDQNFEGSIINVSSVSATVASPNRGEYCISKAGVSMATKLWAVRLGEFGIPVYEVRPGIIATDMTAGVKAKYDLMIETGLLIEKRWGTPDDVGKAVKALVTGELPYATGQVLVLDGGLTLSRL